jgi:diguanylate cyclase (GGDEF)-like protein
MSPEAPPTNPLDARINEDVASRARDGLWGHPACLTLVFITTTLLRDHLAAMSATAAFFFLQTAARLALLNGGRPLCTRRPRVWRQRMTGLLMVSALGWGGLAGWAIYNYGYHNPNTCLLLLYHAAVAVAGTTVFVHSIGLTRIYLALIFLPPMLTEAVHPDADRWGPLCAFSFFALFLAVRARRLCEDYQAQTADYMNLTAIASRDSLTGLPNRMAMQRLLAGEVARARQNSGALALFFIDLDGFKEINDRYSHRAGDLLLCEVARRLTECAGSLQTVCRLGGDEFLMLLTGTASELTPDEVRRRAALTLEAIREPAPIEGNVCAIGASVGISMYPGDAEDADYLVRAADRAMYEAKRTGANQICAAAARRAGLAARIGGAG